MLKRLHLEAPQPASAQGSLTVAVEDASLQEYLAAAQAVAAANTRLELAREVLVERGCQEVMVVNLKHPQTPVGSVFLVDAAGASVNVQFKDSYRSVNLEAAETLFSHLGADINESVHEVPVGKWDRWAFTDALGGCSLVRHNLFVEAVSAAAAQAGVASPLTVERSVEVRPDFHQTRWTRFPGLRQQKLLCKVLPNSVCVAQAKSGPARQGLLTLAA